MRFDATSILLAACCAGALALPACSTRTARAAAPKPAAPAAIPAAPAAEPMSVPQTQVTLPTPQPIPAEALATVRPEALPDSAPANPVARPARVPASPRPEPRQQTAIPAPPPAIQPAPGRRLRPVETPEERQRLLAGITARQRQVLDVLARAKIRQLSPAEKSAADRIQAFLEQTDAAVKDQDLQQAEALSNRALLLCQDLNSGK